MSTGGIGESLLQLWSEHADITCNRSNIDKYGWDYIIEFKNDYYQNECLDRVFNKISCFVQVKTTKENIQEIQIKLSNWDYMVKIPIPTFILFIKLNANNDPCEVYLSHIDLKWIEIVLKKLRETKKRPNKTKLTYKPGLDERIENMDGDKLKERLVSYIGPDFNKYCERKIKFLETLGYTDVKARGRFTAIGYMEDFIDFSLGKKPQLPVRNVSIENDIRFGIPGEVEKFSEGLLQMHLPTVDIKIKIYKTDQYYAIFNAEFHSPFGLIKSLPEDKIRFRVTSDICEIDIRKNNESQCSFVFNFGKIVQKINSLVQMARALIILTNNESDTIIEIIKDKSSVRFKLDSRSVNLENFNATLVQTAYMVDNLFYIMNVCELDQNVALDLDELFTLKDNINEMRAFLDIAYNEQREIRVHLKQEIPRNKIFIPRIIWIKYGDYYCIVCGSYLGEAQLVSKDDTAHQYIYSSKCSSKLIKKIVTLKPTDIDLENEYQKIIPDISENYFIVDARNKKSKEPS